MPAFRFFRQNLALLANATSLIGASLVTAGLGFVYWWLAARLFPASVVGFASAAISAMMLLGNIAVLGLGTLLIGELPKHPSQASSLITTASAVSGAAATLLGVTGALVLSHLVSDLMAIGQNGSTIIVFAIGVSLTTLTLIADQALIGLLRGDLQFARNTIFAMAKLIGIVLIGPAAAQVTGLDIYSTWLVGNLLSLLILLLLVRVSIRYAFAFRLDLIRSLGASALGHYALNLALQVPNLLPVVVTAVLSASVNASFYVSWMFAGFIFLIPNAFSTALFAVVAADTTVLADKLKVSLSLSLLVIVGIWLVSAIITTPLLGLFGEQYAAAAGSFRLLALAAVPLIVKIHYVAVHRVRQRTGYAARYAAVGGTVELLAAWIGGTLGGLNGLCLGWLCAVCLECAAMSPVLFTILFQERQDRAVSQSIPP